MKTAIFNMYVFLSNIGSTGRNTLFVFLCCATGIREYLFNTQPPQSVSSLHTVGLHRSWY